MRAASVVMSAPSLRFAIYDTANTGHAELTTRLWTTVCIKLQTRLWVCEEGVEKPVGNAQLPSRLRPLTSNFTVHSLCEETCLEFRLKVGLRYNTPVDDSLSIAYFESSYNRTVEFAFLTARLVVRLKKSALLFEGIPVVEIIDLDDFRGRYELIADGFVGLPADFNILAGNGEVVRLQIQRAELEPKFQTVLIEPALLPDEAQPWGRTFAGPRLPTWDGLRAAVDSVGVEAADVRAQFQQGRGTKNSKARRRLRRE